MPGQFTIATPIPGSSMYDQLKEEGRLDKDIFWNECNFYNLVYRHEHLSKTATEDALISLYDDVFSNENTIRRLYHMKNFYKTLPGRWS
jgi:hypothetical protein